MPDVYPAGFDWIPDWRLADDETLPWYHDLSSVQRAGPVRATLQLDYDERGRAPRPPGDRRQRTGGPTTAAAGRLVHASARSRTRFPPRTGTATTASRSTPPAFPEPPEPVDPPTRRLRAMVAADRIPITDEQVLGARRGYYGAVSLVDDHVGTLLGTLDEQGCRDDTDRGRHAPTTGTCSASGASGTRWRRSRTRSACRCSCTRPAASARGGSPSRSRCSTSRRRSSTSPEASARTDRPRRSTGSACSRALEGDPAPARDVPLEYLAEGVRAPQVSLVRGSLKLVRDAGEPDLVYDVERDPGRADEPRSGADARARSRERPTRAGISRGSTRTCAQASGRVDSSRAALETGAARPGTTRRGRDGPYIRSGHDFWSRLERSRRV